MHQRTRTESQRLWGIASTQVIRGIEVLRLGKSRFESPQEAYEASQQMLFEKGTTRVTPFLQQGSYEPLIDVDRNHRSS